MWHVLTCERCVRVLRARVQAAGELLDNRSLALSGEPSWIRSGLECFTHSANMTSHDWMQMMQSAGDYILADIVEDKRCTTALYALVAACQACITTFCPADANGDDFDRGKIAALKIQVAEALSLCELVSLRAPCAYSTHLRTNGAIHSASFDNTYILC